jgi:hypothetical protein
MFTIPEAFMLIGHITSLFFPAIYLIDAIRKGWINGPILFGQKFRIVAYGAIFLWSTLTGAISGHPVWILLGVFNSFGLVLWIDLVVNKSNSLLAKADTSGTLVAKDTRLLAKMVCVSTIAAFMCFLVAFFVFEALGYSMADYGSRAIGVTITTFAITLACMLVLEVE